MSRSTRRPGVHVVAREEGVALLAVLLAIFTFSVLAATVLTDRVLESQLASGTELTVSTGAATGVWKAPWPFKVTRTELGQSALRLQIPESGNFVSDLPVGNGPNSVGWYSVVQVAPGVRVCCDGGDNQCQNRTASEGADLLNPVSASFSSSAVVQTLMFSLATGPGTIAPAGTAQAPWYAVDATPQAPDGSADLIAQLTGNQSPGTRLFACRLEKAGEMLAAGVVRLDGNDVATADLSDGRLHGTLKLDYFRPPSAK